MEISPSERKEFYSALCTKIAENVARIIGGTAYTLAATVKGVSVSDKMQLSVSEGFSKDDVDSFVNIYVKIIGPVAKTLAGRACASFEQIKSGKFGADELNSLIPSWLVSLEASFSEHSDGKGGH